MDIWIWTLILQIVGGFISTSMAILDWKHQRVYGEKEWWKRYYWSGWSPIYKNTETLQWKIKLNRMVVKYDFIPPKHAWAIIGFLFVLVGVILQLTFYLKI